MDINNFKTINIPFQQNNSIVVLPPFALYHSKNINENSSQSTLRSTNQNKILLNLTKERNTKKYYDKDARMPYMDSNIDLSFPEIKTQVMLD